MNTERYKGQMVRNSIIIVWFMLYNTITVIECSNTHYCSIGVSKEVRVKVRVRDRGVELTITLTLLII